jgi:Circularly permutated YpsA SLOG family
MCCVTLIATRYLGTIHAFVFLNAITEAPAVGLLQQTCQLKDFIEANAIEVLNLAGSRESKEPGIYQFTLKLLRRYWQNRAEPIDRLEHPQE